MRAGDERAVVVEAEVAAALVVVEPELALELAVVELDCPAQAGEPGEPLRALGLGEVREAIGVDPVSLTPPRLGLQAPERSRGAKDETAVSAGVPPGGGPVGAEQREAAGDDRA